MAMDDKPKDKNDNSSEQGRNYTVGYGKPPASENSRLESPAIQKVGQRGLKTSTQLDMKLGLKIS